MGKRHQDAKTKQRKNQGKPTSTARTQRGQPLPTFEPEYILVSLRLRVFALSWC